MVFGTFAFLTSRRPTLRDTQNVVGAPTSARAYHTGKGQRATIQLTDGSRVMLSVESHLWYSENPETGERIATLSGEAYFDITPNISRPFVIVTGDVTTRVLGTTFSVRRYEGDSETRVVVRSGRVEFHDAVLDARMVGRKTADGVLVSHEDDVDRLLGWVDGRLEFQQQPLREVLRDLSRWYDFDFRSGDPDLDSIEITSTLTNASVDEAAQVIMRAIKAEYIRTGRSITFSRRSP